MGTININHDEMKHFSYIKEIGSIMSNVLYDAEKDSPKGDSSFLNFRNRVVPHIYGNGLEFSFEIDYSVQKNEITFWDETSNDD
ncbi:MAG: hypothetical protein FWD05_04735 [Oscillospiraceae bacterium]|nr:hypothetical protein [Oscillospiraceae bacterium]